MRPGALDIRVAEQVALLDRAAGLLKSGGRIVYVTCSLLAEENGDQIRNFLARHPDFHALAAPELARPLGERAAEFEQAVLASPEGLLMTPRRTETDGFFVAVLTRRGSSPTAEKGAQVTVTEW
jgi:16S rRNA (cytosine967-C5)-methyltransferase